jgi:hypothetical protein
MIDMFGNNCASGQKGPRRGSSRVDHGHRLATLLSLIDGNGGIFREYADPKILGTILGAIVLRGRVESRHASRGRKSAKRVYIQPFDWDEYRTLFQMFLEPFEQFKRVHEFRLGGKTFDWLVEKGMPLDDDDDHAPSLLDPVFLSNLRNFCRKANRVAGFVEGSDHCAVKAFDEVVSEAENPLFKIDIPNESLPRRGPVPPNAFNPYSLKPKDRPGYVYFIKDARDNNVKIGFSQDPEERIKDLMTGNFHLWLYGMLPGPQKVEKLLHRILKNKRITVNRGGRSWHTEWFGPDVMEYIDSLLISKLGINLVRGH